MILTLIVVGGWVVVSLPFGLLLAGAMGVCESKSVANLPQSLSHPRRTVDARLDVAA
jgi:hypothetical protein